MGFSYIRSKSEMFCLFSDPVSLSVCAGTSGEKPPPCPSCVCAWDGRLVVRKLLRKKGKNEKNEKKRSQLKSTLGLPGHHSLGIATRLQRGRNLFSLIRHKTRKAEWKFRHSTPALNRPANTRPPFCVVINHEKKDVGGDDGQVKTPGFTVSRRREKLFLHIAGQCCEVNNRYKASGPAINLLFS